MKILLDTHVLLWLVFDDPRLKPAMRDAILAADVLVSAVSVVEVSIKTAIGKLSVEDSIWEALLSAGVTPLPFTWTHGQAMRALPMHHRDPFDRMLIAQAMVEGCTLATLDSQIIRYDVALLGR